MITEQKKDSLINALSCGMAKEDAYIYAGLTSREIEEVGLDENMMNTMAQINKRFEFQLLNQMVDISEKQSHMGKEGATAWLLEKLFPRYSGKPISDTGEVHIHLDPTDPAEYDTVEIHRKKSGS